MSAPPLGIQPSLQVIDRVANESPFGFKDEYEVHEWALLGSGDILLLYADGVSEHADDRYCPDRLEDQLRKVKHRSAREICEAILADMLALSAPSDDITLVIVKRG